MSLRRVVVHPSGIVHYGTPRPAVSLALLLPGYRSLTIEEVGEDAWHYWRTLCGKEVIGRTNDEFYPEVTCRACLRGFEKGQRDYAAMAERFGAIT